MPSAPELGGRLGDIGIVKVHSVVESEHPTQTDRHIRIGREVIVNLQRVQQHAKPGACHRQLVERRIQILRHQLAGDVCHQHLFAQSDTEAGDSLTHIAGSGAAVFDFGGNVAVSHNRACHQLVIAGQVHQVLVILLLCGNLSAVDIHHIADGLEGIKRDADGQRNLRHRQRQSGQ